MPRHDRLRALIGASLLLVALAATASAEERIELKSVTYQAKLARDPFQIPDFTAISQRSTKELNLNTATLVGVVKLPDGFIALVEDENGDSYALVKGDPVWRGRVGEIDEDTLVAWVRNGDLNQRIRLELVKEGE